VIQFQIDSGEISQNAETIDMGYSGAPGHVNNPADCGLVGEGPIPPGVWQMGDPVNDPETGVFSIPLWMIQGDPLGRDVYTPGNFRWHGDNASKPPQSSSKGCLVSGHASRVIGASDPDRLLTVIP
jgi:hypothetical protein